jgi:hypothetical protein
MTSHWIIESHRARVMLLGLLVSGATLLRVLLALHLGLWVDEIFSLAMATEHSLEHPANAANPALGDYVEPPDPTPPSVFRRYLEHDASPAGPSRVIRAVPLLWDGAGITRDARGGALKLSTAALGSFVHE